MNIKINNRPLDTEDEVPLGQTRLRLGDVLPWMGKDYIVRRVSASNATCTPLNGNGTRTFTPRFGDKEVSIPDNGRDISISNCVDKQLVKERRGEAGYNEFLASKKSKRGATETTQPKDEEDMSTNKKARGGLAAAVADRKAKEKKPKAEKKAKTPKAKVERAEGTAETKKGVGRGGNPVKHKQKIMGHSVCSVLRKLGAEGVSNEHATAIMAKHGVVMPAASLACQVSFFGKNGKKKAAPLTKEQVKELKECAPEPEQEKKAA